MLIKSAPGRSCVVQSSTRLEAGRFSNLSPVIQVPADYAGTTTSYLHAGAGVDPAALLYRIRLLP